VPLDFQDLQALIVTLNQTDVTELTIKSDEFEVTIRRGVVPNEFQGVSPAVSTVTARPLAPVITTPSVVQSDASPATLAPSTPQIPAPPTPSEKLVDVTSPMVGTFYRSPAPDEPPFVDTGDRIRMGQVVCIIEAMKLMNEIEAEVMGEIVEILVKNGEPVEYGQVLMRVKST
jgi:acetyl-CoA carboxylase biotin carboxyl carrier protein